jgi:hypothetical protein
VTSQAGSAAGGVATALAHWLLPAAIGPAAVAVPVNLVADTLCAAAEEWFKRLRQSDDLSRLVKAASGTSLSRDEINKLRRLLAKEETWQALGAARRDDELQELHELQELTDQIAGCLQPRDGQREAAEVIAHGLTEFAVYKLQPATFQKVVQARLQQMTDQASALDEALLHMHEDLYYLRGEAKDLFREVTDRLPPWPAGPNEIRIYLRTLISWLDNDPWPRDPRLGGPVLTPSVIERRLRVSDDSSATEQDADELARKCRRLVILGEPGSGKTWLAKRITRLCAEEALRALEDYAALDEIELPLYTTCSRLVTALGGICEAAVSSAVERIGDMGSSRITDALRVYFGERASRTLLVIDSLDEASDTKAVTERLREVDSLQSPWRLVLTSRRNSWKNQINVDENQDGRLGELLPLSYPADVEAIIQRWFADNHERGQALAAQIARQPGLRRGARVPLILAFYCILGGQQPLPEFTHDLYEQVINRMLAAPWRPGGDPPPAPRACRDVLQAWAWQGARNDPFSGMAAWEDDLPDLQAQLSAADQAAVDHVAVPDAPGYDADVPVRRFVHRVIREYLVAKHIADLDQADQAARELLPHLWYDPDWGYTAPMAIAMHSDRNELLRILLRRVSRTGEVPRDPSADGAGNAVREMLALVAAESEQDVWSTETATVIGQARVELARSGTVIMAAGWRESNSQIRQIAVTQMAGDISSQETSRWVRDLAELGPSPGDKHLASEAVVRQLRTEAYGGWVRSLADALATLEPAPADKDRTREVLLDRLGASPCTPDLAAALLLLEPSPDDKRRALVTMLTQLADPAYPLNQWHGAPDIGSVPMPDVLVRLEPTADDMKRARDVLFERLGRERSGDMAVRLMDMLIRLDPAPPARQQVFDVGIQLLLLFADQRLASSAPPLVKAVMGLVQSAEEKHRALDTLIRYLSGQVTMTLALAADLASFAAQFDPTPDDKRLACQVLLKLLPAPGNLVLWETKSARNLVAAFLQLDPEPDDMSQARRTLLGLLSQAVLEGNRKRQASVPAGVRRMPYERNYSEVAADLAAVLLQLDPEPDDMSQARRTLLGLLTNQDRSGETAARADVAVMLGKLDLSPSDKGQVRGALLALLARDTGGTDAKKLVGALAQVDPEPSDTRRARRILHDLLRGKAIHSAGAAGIMTGLTLLDATPDDLRQAREEARDALLAQISTGDLPTFETAAKNVSVLVRLASTPEEERQTLDGLLGLLERIMDGQVAEDLIGGIAQLHPTARDLSSWRTWATPPSGELLAAARRNSALHDWLTIVSP